MCFRESHDLYFLLLKSKSWPVKKSRFVSTFSFAKDKSCYLFIWKQFVTVPPWCTFTTVVSYDQNDSRARGTKKLAMHRQRRRNSALTLSPIRDRARERPRSKLILVSALFAEFENLAPYFIIVKIDKNKNFVVCPFLNAKQVEIFWRIKSLKRENFWTHKNDCRE